MHQLTNFHGLNQYWSLNYTYTWDSTKFKKDNPYNLREVTEYKI